MNNNRFDYSWLILSKLDFYWRLKSFQITYPPSQCRILLIFSHHNPALFQCRIPIDSIDLTRHQGDVDCKNSIKIGGSINPLIN